MILSHISDCPYGDADPRKCALMIEDNIGTGNCYNQIKRRECCETCAEYHNATFTGTPSSVTLVGPNMQMTKFTSVKFQKSYFIRDIIYGSSKD